MGQDNNSGQNSAPRSKKSIFLGILILVVQVGILFAYGFGGQFRYVVGQSTKNQQGWLSLYFYLGLFVVGMGLMLSYYGKGTALGLGTAIFAIALNTLLGPLIQKFWFNVFIGGFDLLITPSSISSEAARYMFGEKAYVGYLTIFNSGAMTISYLISALAFIGRAGIFQIFTSLLVFNIMWPLAFMVNLKIYITDMINQIAFDDFGLTYIYTFAAIFGIVYSIFLNYRAQKSLQNSHASKTSLILSIFGAALVFCVLPLVGFNYIRQADTDRINVGFLNIYYSSIASIIICIIFSLIFGKGRFRVENIIVSVLSGPAISAQLAATQGNIVAFLVIGAVGGLLTAIWTQLIHPKINKNIIQDSVGLIGGVLIPSFFGGIIVAPVLFRIYIDNGSTRLTGFIGPDEQLISHNYIYYFISVGAAAVGGIIAGFFSCCTRSNQHDNTHYKLFSSDFGLCNSPSDEPYIDQKNSNNEKQPSAENLHKN